MNPGTCIFYFIFVVCPLLWLIRALIVFFRAPGQNIAAFGNWLKTAAKVGAVCLGILVVVAMLVLHIGVGYLHFALIAAAFMFAAGCIGKFLEELSAKQRK